MLLTPDWGKVNTLEILRYENWSALRVGWNETSEKTALLTPVPTLGEGPQKYLLQVWNQPGVRAGLAQLLGLHVSFHSTAESGKDLDDIRWYPYNETFKSYAPGMKLENARRFIKAKNEERGGYYVLHSAKERRENLCKS